MSSEYDVRNPEQPKPNVFRFKDSSAAASSADRDVVKVVSNHVYLSNTTAPPGSPNATMIGSYDDARNLIKALQKAIEVHDKKVLTRKASET